MNIDNKLELVRAGWILLPILLPLLLIHLLPRPKQWGWRAVIAALGSSALWILYTTELYYPLYHAASWQRDENPNVHFDSERLDMIRYFLAWVVPGAVVVAAGICRVAVRWFTRLRKGRSGPDVSDAVRDF